MIGNSDHKILMTDTTHPRQTPLHSIHPRLGARLIEFYGWQMPVQYSSIIEEHNSVRNNVGIFDLSHMGEISVKGKGAFDYLQKLITNDLSKLYDGRALYSVVCNENGGIVDDVLVYRNKEDDYFVVVNASNIEKDYHWFIKNLDEDARVENLSYVTALIAVQGPKAKGVVGNIVKDSVDEFYYYHCRQDIIGDTPVLLARTGYTGEDGFEIYVEDVDALKVWEIVWNEGKKIGMKPVGLGARDTLRLEMAYCLYGNELTEEINPIDAGLGWVVSIKKNRFIGKDAIKKIKEKGTTRKIVGFELTDRGVPRQHYSVKKGGEVIGEVTSGTLSPTLNKGIGLALLKKEYANIGEEIEIEIRGKNTKAQVVRTPFCESRVYKKSK